MEWGQELNGDRMIGMELGKNGWNGIGEEWLEWNWGRMEWGQKGWNGMGQSEMGTEGLEWNGTERLEWNGTEWNWSERQWVKWNWDKQLLALVSDSIHKR